MKRFIRAALFRMLGIERQERLALALLRNVAREAGTQDVGQLEVFHCALEESSCALEDRIRRAKYHGRRVPTQGDQSSRAPMSALIQEPSAPWRTVEIPRLDIPGMISDEEAQYYEWVGSLFEGRGEVVEVGPWLGRSTMHIIRGLLPNQRFHGRRLHVFDDFVWRASWMDRHYPGPDRPANHGDFQPLFDRHTGAVAQHLRVSRGRLANYNGNEWLPRIEWSGEPIEMMYVDTGRTLLVNEAWFEIFSPAFIPGVTLLLLQDWRTHRERPREYYNQMLQFTQGHAAQLELLHEVSMGGLATFLYLG